MREASDGILFTETFLDRNFLDRNPEQFKRWLREGILSGKPAGTVQGISDILFFLAFTFCYSWEFINTTMFKKAFSDEFELRMEGTYHLMVIVALLCGVTALLFAGSLRQAAFEAALLAAGFLHWKFGAGKYGYFVICVLIVGMTGRSFKALLSIAFSIGSAIMAAAFIASQTGVIEDLVYEGGRHSFGIVYCTDCAAHLLFLMIMYAMLRLEKLQLADYSVMILVCAIILMTKAASDIACAVLLMAGLFVYRLTKRWRKTRALRFISAAASFSYLLCTALSFIVTLGFDRNDQKLRRKLQYSMIRRLEMNQEAIRDNPFTLFGTKIEEHGFGGRTKNLPGWDEYFFIDCSYIRLFVIGGMLLFVLILLTMTYAQIRCFAFRNYGFVFLLSLVAVSCLMEHHLLEYYYNVFPLIAFSGKTFLNQQHIRTKKQAAPSGTEHKAQDRDPDVPVLAEAGDLQDH